MPNYLLSSYPPPNRTCLFLPLLFQQSRQSGLPSLPEFGTSTCIISQQVCVYTLSFQHSPVQSLEVHLENELKRSLCSQPHTTRTPQSLFPEFLTLPLRLLHLYVHLYKVFFVQLLHLLSIFFPLPFKFFQPHYRHQLLLFSLRILFIFPLMYRMDHCTKHGL